MKVLHGIWVFCLFLHVTTAVQANKAKTGKIGRGLSFPGVITPPPDERDNKASERAREKEE